MLHSADILVFFSSLVVLRYALAGVSTARLKEPDRRSNVDEIGSSFGEAGRLTI